jgi:hypothetical protein
MAGRHLEGNITDHRNISMDETSKGQRMEESFGEGRVQKEM